MVENGLDIVLLDLINRINTIKRNGEYVFKTVAVWNQQIKRQQKNNYVINYPACWVELNIVDNSYVGDQVTVNDVVIKLHLANWVMDASDGYMDQNLYIFELRDILKYEMTLFKPTGCGYMQWYGDIESFDHRNIYEFIMKFKVHYVDTTSRPTYTGQQVYYVGSTPSINITATYSGWTSSYPLS